MYAPDSFLEQMCAKTILNNTDSSSLFFMHYSSVGII